MNRKLLRVLMLCGRQESDEPDEDHHAERLQRHFDFAPKESHSTPPVNGSHAGRGAMIYRGETLCISIARPTKRRSLSRR